MSSNPYFDPNADDDILGEVGRSSEGRHVLDGSPCPKCNGKTHEFSIPPGAPQEVLDQLSDMLDTMPAELVESAQFIVSRETPGKIQLIGQLMAFIKQVNESNPTGPLVRAIAEVLDEQTGGEVYRRWRLYKTERDIIVAHAILKSVNSLLDGVRTMDNESNKIGSEGTSIIELLERTLDKSLGELREASEGYTKVCAELGLEPDQGLLEVGVPNITYGPLAQHTMKDWLDIAINKVIEGN